MNRVADRLRLEMEDLDHRLLDLTSPEAVAWSRLVCLRRALELWNTVAAEAAHGSYRDTDETRRQAAVSAFQRSSELLKELHAIEPTQVDLDQLTDRVERCINDQPNAS